MNRRHGCLGNKHPWFFISTANAVDKAWRKGSGMPDIDIVNVQQRLDRVRSKLPLSDPAVAYMQGLFDGYLLSGTLTPPLLPLILWLERYEMANNLPPITKEIQNGTR